MFAHQQHHAKNEGHRMSLHQDHVANVGPKIAALWAMWGISSWSDLAGFLAAILSTLALAEYLWKKIIRPTCVYFGWMSPYKRRVLERVDDE